MKTSNNYLLALFLLTCFFLSNITSSRFKIQNSLENSFFTKSIATNCNVSLNKAKEFASSLQDIKEETKTSIACNSNQCRNWMEQSLIAFCKAEDFRKKAEFPLLKPLHVAYKSSNKEEFSQFIFHLNTNNDMSNKDQMVVKGVEGKILFRVCVSVDRSKKSYVDYKCPLARCTEYSKVGECDTQIIKEKNCKNDKQLLSNI